jgi:hypothetical protein
MLIRRLLFSMTACLIATAVFADEPECAANFKSNATSAETSVLTALAPKTVIEVLPRKLAAAGAPMDWAQPTKGLLKAGPVDVKAEIAGSATRVTFRVSPPVDKATLCRYASLVGNPPLPPAAPVAQDPALIALLKNDLRLKHEIVQPNTVGLNKATFLSLDDFLQFVITGIKDLPKDKREYNVVIMMPPYACGIASEDLDITTLAGLGQSEQHRTKPVRVEVTLLYDKDAEGWKFNDAFITHIATPK